MFFLKSNASEFSIAYGKEWHPTQFVLTQFPPRKAMSQSQFCNIDYSGSYRPFQSKQFQLIKIKINHLYWITLKIIIIYLIKKNSNGMAFNCRIIQLRRLFIYLYSSTTGCLFIILNSHYGDFQVLYFRSLSKKSDQYTTAQADDFLFVLCVELLLALPGLASYYFFLWVPVVHPAWKEHHGFNSNIIYNKKDSRRPYS